MKKFSWTVLLVCACAGLGLGPTRMAAAQNPSVAEHVKQLELDWVKAEQAADVTRLGEILARDWMGFGPGGSRRNRQQYLDVVKGGRYKLESFETGPIDVKVLGNVAVAQGSEKPPLQIAPRLDLAIPEFQKAGIPIGDVLPSQPLL